MNLEQRVDRHNAERKTAQRLYRAGLTPCRERPRWFETVRRVREKIERTYQATRRLGEIGTALEASGSHSQVLRFLLAPPLSQDQFKLACPAWSKSTEKSGRALSREAATTVANAISDWLDPRRLQALRSKDHAIVQATLDSTAYLMAAQLYRTERRMRLAEEQEESVRASLVDDLHFREVPAQRVDRAGLLAPGEFMRKTLFKTADGSAHEVDIAIGLKGTAVLALECKVSNDSTNSVKRVNDILKKAEAWRTQWGRFVTTGAVLQGVFSEKEPRRLLSQDVLIFWSHDLSTLGEWLQRNGAAKRG